MQRYCWRNGLHPKDLAECGIDGAGGAVAVFRPLAARLKEGLDEKHGAWRLLANLKRQGVQILTPKSALYPASLSLLEEVTPVPLLLAAGDLELLTRPRVAFVSSRAVSEHGLRKAEALAGRVRNHGGVIVGEQSRALDLALNPEVVLPPAGLLAFLEKNDAGHRLAVSPWSPDYTSHDRYATTRMQVERTWVLLGLSSLTTVIELKRGSRMTGIFERAKEIGLRVCDGNPFHDGSEIARLVEGAQRDEKER